MQKNILLFFSFLFLLQLCTLAQSVDSVKSGYHIKGAVTVTNKGISFIPTFTLGKPAAIFDLSMGKKKLFFEPQLRFSLSGKPWSFLFWWRYKLIATNKVSIMLGAHPALNFKKELVTLNGISKEVMVTRRYLAGELAPNYLVSKNVSVGLYYLYSRGIDNGSTRNTHFLTINSVISNISLGGSYFARFIPQIYYLQQDRKDGFFLTSTLTLARKHFPLSLQSLINKKIESDIPGSQNFVWNVSLIYSFSNNYVKK